MQIERLYRNFLSILNFECVLDVSCFALNRHPHTSYPWKKKTEIDRYLKRMLNTRHNKWRRRLDKKEQRIFFMTLSSSTPRNDSHRYCCHDWSCCRLFSFIAVGWRTRMVMTMLFFAPPLTFFFYSCINILSRRTEIEFFSYSSSFVRLLFLLYFFTLNETWIIKVRFWRFKHISSGERKRDSWQRKVWYWYFAIFILISSPSAIHDVEMPTS